MWAIVDSGWSPDMVRLSRACSSANKGDASWGRWATIRGKFMVDVAALYLVWFALLDRRTHENDHG